MKSDLMKTREFDINAFSYQNEEDNEMNMFEDDYLYEEKEETHYI